MVPPLDVVDEYVVCSVRLGPHDQVLFIYTAATYIIVRNNKCYCQLNSFHLISPLLFIQKEYDDV